MGSSEVEGSLNSRRRKLGADQAQDCRAVITLNVIILLQKAGSWGTVWSWGWPFQFHQGSCGAPDSGDRQGMEFSGEMKEWDFRFLRGAHTPRLLWVHLSGQTCSFPHGAWQELRWRAWDTW